MHDIYRAWRAIADAYGRPRSSSARSGCRTPSASPATCAPDELHTAFNFDFLRCAWDAGALRDVIDEHAGRCTPGRRPATWVLSNHDVTGTSPGTAARTPRSPARGATAPADLALGTRRARAAALLTLALPGSVYLYQGEELGLPEVEDLPADAAPGPDLVRSGHTEPGRDGCRVPLPWSGDGAAVRLLAAGPRARLAAAAHDWARR